MSTPALTNIDLFKLFVEFHNTEPSATLCKILGPINFSMWLTQKNIVVTDDLMYRIKLLNNIMVNVIEHTNDS